MIERWLPVVGYEEIYSISNMGNVFSIRNNIILKPMKDHKKYLVVDLRNKGHRKTRKIAHLVIEAFLGKRPKGYEVNHKDGVKSNNRIINLEYVTPIENIRHSYRIGLHIKDRSGENHSMSKLTWKEVNFIRKEYVPRKITQIYLVSKYNISQQTICYILQGKLWKKNLNIKSLASADDQANR